MRHFASPAFWEHYQKLPASMRAIADKNYALLKADPWHPSLHFEKVGEYWSVRIGRGYRALATDVGGQLVWFWIGSHKDYDQLIK